jgi:hypothetical protein
MHLKNFTARKSNTSGFVLQMVKDSNSGKEHFFWGSPGKSNRVPSSDIGSALKYIAKIKPELRKDIVVEFDVAKTYPSGASYILRTMKITAKTSIMCADFAEKKWVFNARERDWIDFNSPLEDVLVDCVSECDISVIASVNGVTDFYDMTVFDYLSERARNKTVSTVAEIKDYENSTYMQLFGNKSIPRIKNVSVRLAYDENYDKLLGYLHKSPKKTRSLKKMFLWKREPYHFEILHSALVAMYTKMSIKKHTKRNELTPIVFFERDGVKTHIDKSTYMVEVEVDVPRRVSSDDKTIKGYLMDCGDKFTYSINYAAVMSEEKANKTVEDFRKTWKEDAVFKVVKVFDYLDDHKGVYTAQIDEDTSTKKPYTKSLYMSTEKKFGERPERNYINATLV